MTGSGFSRIQTSDQTKLTRGLKRRHIELIAISGAIGVGLFLGSAKVIQNAGPGLILGYAVGGLVIFFIMEPVGPAGRETSEGTDEFVGIGHERARDRAIQEQFAQGAHTWVVTWMAELTAIGVYVSYWLPAFPQWITVLAALVVLYGARIRRDGVLVCIDQSLDDRHAHCGRAGSHPFRRWKLRGDRGILQSLLAWRFSTFRHTRCVAHIPDGDVWVSGSGVDRRDRRRGRESRGRPALGHQQHHLPHPDLLYWRIDRDHVAGPLE